MIEQYADQYSIPLVGLLALGQAESGWRRTAERWGIWPDVSFGSTQITVRLAAAYGIGDGTEASALVVRDALFDRETAIRLGADYYAQGLARAAAMFSGLEGDALLLQGLIAYNSGSPQPEGNWYWQDWSGNIASYRAALVWAHGIVG